MSISLETFLREAELSHIVSPDKQLQSVSVGYSDGSTESYEPKDSLSPQSSKGSESLSSPTSLIQRYFGLRHRSPPEQNTAIERTPRSLSASPGRYTSTPKHGSNAPARPKYTPIVLPVHLPAPYAEPFSDLGVKLNSSLAPGSGTRALPNPRSYGPAPSNVAPHQKRYVEIVIPELPCSEDLTTSPEVPQDSPLAPEANFAILSNNDPASTVVYPVTKSGMDVLDPSEPKDDLASQSSGMESGRPSPPDRDDIESNPELGVQQHAPSQHVHEHPMSNNNVVPSSTHSNTVSTSNASSHLSGLVCNVHRTTGKEPHALVGATTTILGDKLYVFGGRRISRNRPALTSDLYELDLLTRHWTKLETKGDVPPPRYFHSMCSLGDNKLVCYGGMSPEAPAGQGGKGTSTEPTDAQVSVMSDIHIYDALTKSWMKVHCPEAPQGRYAHCAAILPSSAVFASATAPVSAIQHNAEGVEPNQGSVGASLDGTGGAEMVVVGGQDSANHYIEQISIFNLRSLKWTSTKPMPGRSCGAYRSVVTPLTSMNAARIGAGTGRADEEDDDADDDDASISGSPMLIYTNYNFLDVKLELQVRLPDGSLADKVMQGSLSPPGLRFPSGGIIDNNFVVAGTFLTSSKQEFALWALDLHTLTWARIEVANSTFNSGSWNRGVLWNRRNAFVILGNRKRNLVDDYNNRRLNFSNIALVQLEAFGLYDNPRKTQPLSHYTSMSAPKMPVVQPTMDAPGGRRLEPAAVGLGEISMGLKEIADMDFLAINGTRLPVNSRLVAKRWGPSFNTLMQEANPVMSDTETETGTLRLGNASQMSRNSSVTITPSAGTRYSTATTLTANATAAPSVPEPADVQAFAPFSRPRILYLPHTVSTLQTLIHYLYTSSLPPVSSPLVTPQILCSLLQLARPYKIDGLLEAVVERLHESLDGRNAAAIFNAAAMGAGGGDGVTFLPANRPTHPPRAASLAGIEALNLGNGAPGGVRGPLRINTEMSNGVHTGRSSRSASISEAAEEDEEPVPDSASTNESMSSQMGLPQRAGDKENRDIWDGGWSAVIGLQKRGLRGLMEGRKMRERGRNESGSTSTAMSTGESSNRVGLGIA